MAFFRVYAQPYERLFSLPVSVLFEYFWQFGGYFFSQEFSWQKSEPLSTVLDTLSFRMILHFLSVFQSVAHTFHNQNGRAEKTKKGFPN